MKQWLVTIEVDVEAGSEATAALAGARTIRQTLTGGPQPMRVLVGDPDTDTLTAWLVDHEGFAERESSLGPTKQGVQQ